jgi:hypothetical protein
MEEARGSWDIVRVDIALLLELREALDHLDGLRPAGDLARGQQRAQEGVEQRAREHAAPSGEMNDDPGQRVLHRAQLGAQGARESPLGAMATDRVGDRRRHEAERPADEEQRKIALDGARREGRAGGIEIFVPHAWFTPALLTAWGAMCESGGCPSG